MNPTQVLFLLEIPASNNLVINESSIQVGYIIGAVIALFILGYLTFSLFKPDKF
jgi:K+-transporting ATPase KdpF subunit